MTIWPGPGDNAGWLVLHGWIIVCHWVSQLGDALVCVRLASGARLLPERQKGISNSYLFLVPVWCVTRSVPLEFWRGVKRLHSTLLFFAMLCYDLICVCCFVVRSYRSQWFAGLILRQYAQQSSTLIQQSQDLTFAIPSHHSRRWLIGFSYRERSWRKRVHDPAGCSTQNSLIRKIRPPGSFLEYLIWNMLLVYCIYVIIYY